MGERARQAEPEELPEGDGFTNRVGTPMEVTNWVEPLDGQGQGGQQPTEEQAVGLVMAEVLEALAVLGVVATLVLDFPAALRQRITRCGG